MGQKVGNMDIVDNYRLRLGADEYVPIVTGGMGVDISTAELALEACRLGGVGHISDAMVPFVSDRKYGTKFSHRKAEQFRDTVHSLDKSQVKFALEIVREAQVNHVQRTMERKSGEGAIFLNVMEKLTMGSPHETLHARLTAALDAGIDGITLSAGLHTTSMRLMQEHPRFRDAKIGVIVSSSRALHIFLRSASRVGRMPDYIVVEGPLAGGHLGFGQEDWKEHTLQGVIEDVLHYLKSKGLGIPVIAAGGVFTGTDAVEMLQLGASAVQVATRFTVTEECGLPESVKQKYFAALPEDVVVSNVSPTGYPIRLLTNSPCLKSNMRPGCEALGYILDAKGCCPYIDAYACREEDSSGRKLPVEEKVCLCYHFGMYHCYTCGHNVYRLKDTSRQREDGSYELLSVEHVFGDYQFSRDHQIAVPPKNGEKVAGSAHVGAQAS